MVRWVPFLIESKPGSEGIWSGFSLSLSDIVRYHLVRVLGLGIEPEDICNIQLNWTEVELVELRESSRKDPPLAAVLIVRRGEVMDLEDVA